MKVLLSFPSFPGSPYVVFTLYGMPRIICINWVGDSEIMYCLAFFTKKYLLYIYA